MFGKKGFTMVELLVVMIILGVLVAVAAPIYFANVDRAKASEAVAGMGLIRQAEREYYIKNKDYLAVTGTTTAVDTTLDVDLGATQYFSNKCYSVTKPSGTPAVLSFTNGDAAVGFLIKADGTKSETLDSGTGRGAVHYTDVGGGTGTADVQLEMDNSGRILVSYKDDSVGATKRSWKDY